MPVASLSVRCRYLRVCLRSSGVSASVSVSASVAAGLRWVLDRLNRTIKISMLKCHVTMVCMAICLCSTLVHIIIQPSVYLLHSMYIEGCLAELCKLED